MQKMKLLEYFFSYYLWSILCLLPLIIFSFLGCVIDGDDVHSNENDEGLEVRLFNLSFSIE